MAAYAEGFNILRHANVGSTEQQHDAEKHPGTYRYDFDLGRLPSCGAAARGQFLVTGFYCPRPAGATCPRILRRARLGLGRGALDPDAAIDESVPVPVLSAALFQPFLPRGEGDFANRVLSAMRAEFGGHKENHEQQVQVARPRIPQSRLPPGSLVHVGLVLVDETCISVIDYSPESVSESRVESIEQLLPTGTKETSPGDRRGPARVEVIEQIRAMFGIHQLVPEDIPNTPPETEI